MDDGDLMSIGTQVAMVGATMPSSLKQILGDVVPVCTSHHFLVNVSIKFLKYIIELLCCEMTA